MFEDSLWRTTRIDVLILGREPTELLVEVISTKVTQGDGEKITLKDVT